MPRQLTHLEALSTTAEEIVAADPARTAIYFRNEDASIIVRVGPAGVTGDDTVATAGFAILAGEVLPFVSSPQGGATGAQLAWYAISESGTPNLGVLEILED